MADGRINDGPYLQFAGFCEEMSKTPAGELTIRGLRRVIETSAIGAVVPLDLRVAVTGGASPRPWEVQAVVHSAGGVVGQPVTRGEATFKGGSHGLRLALDVPFSDLGDYEVRVTLGTQRILVPLTVRLARA